MVRTCCHAMAMAGLLALGAPAGVALADDGVAAPKANQLTGRDVPTPGSPALRFDLCYDSWGLPTCFATTAAGSQASLLTRPDGNGRWLSDARTSPTVGQSLAIDATITLTIRDGNNDPVPDYPAEEMWLETTMGGLQLCPAGSIADHPTDVNGQTTWMGPIRGGGFTNRAAAERTVVVVSGYALSVWPLNIQHNSPDITGDLVVNLSDIVQFKNALSTGYHYEADLAFDQQLNLSDIVLMAAGLGAQCPSGWK